MAGCSNLCGGIFVQVDILEPTRTIDNEGYEVNAPYTILETIMADKQPLSGELAEKVYGLTDRNIKSQLLINKTVDNLTERKDEGRKILINSDTSNPYEVRAIKDWGISKEVAIKPYLKDIEVV